MPRGSLENHFFCWPTSSTYCRVSGRGGDRQSASPPWLHVERDAGREQGAVGASRVGGKAGRRASLNRMHGRRRKRAPAAASSSSGGARVPAAGERRFQKRRKFSSGGDKRAPAAAAERGRTPARQRVEQEVARAKGGRPPARWREDARSTSRAVGARLRGELEFAGEKLRARESTGASAGNCDCERDAAIDRLGMR